MFQKCLLFSEIHKLYVTKAFRAVEMSRFVRNQFIN